MATVKIKEFAMIAGIAESAVRYYERIGILPTVGRLTNGYREFDDEDVQWMEFVTRLRKTGMPMAKIVEFSRLREQGATTLPERRVLLEDHEKRLVLEIESKTRHLQRIREKIELYRKT